MKLRLLPPFLSLLAAYVSVQSCTDNPAAYSGILGPTREPTETPSDTGGSAGTGGGPTGGSATTGGTGPSTGGAGVDGGVGGQGEGGEGATSGTGGGKGGKGGSAGSGTGGTGVVNPPPHPDFLPPCFLGPTSAGEEILKGVACAPEDPQLCYRPCGPNQSGWKSEDCTAGVYTEGDCVFPMDGDYSCYKIPDPIDEGACGVTSPPKATGECGAPSCTVCNFEGFYLDSGNDAKEGYCICREPGPDGVRRWTCASATAWPCPLNRGC
jgi:hypothetical protein